MKQMEKMYEDKEKEAADRVREMERDWMLRKEEFVRQQENMADQLRQSQLLEAMRERELKDAKRKH
jgi:hypothetical protein